MQKDKLRYRSRRQKAQEYHDGYDMTYKLNKKVRSLTPKAWGLCKETNMLTKRKLYANMFFKKTTNFAEFNKIFGLE